MYKINEFKCLKCGSNKISYEKWISCRMPVEIQNNHIYYGLPVINEEIDLDGIAGFICGNCGNQIYYRGCKIEAEEELIGYLSIDTETREKEEKEYIDSLEPEFMADSDEENIINELICAEEEHFAEINEGITKNISNNK